eukprot:gene1661-2004_t
MHPYIPINLESAVDVATLHSKANRGFLSAVAATAADKPTDPVSSAATSEEHLPGQPVPEFDGVADWIGQHGGQVNVEVRQSPDRGRFVVAPRHIKSGTTALDPALQQASAAFLWAEIKDPNSKFGPYFETLPPRDGVLSYYDIPASYLPLIQHETLEKVIRTIQSDLQEIWDADQEAYKKALGPEVSIEDIRYSSTLLETRAITLAVAGERLLPVFDMSNHRNDCPHRLMSPQSIGPCPGSSKKKTKQDCLLWTARADVAAGDEVCNRYTDYLLQDRALLQYGFLQDGPTVHELSGIDRHDFDPEEPWRDPPLGKKGKPKKFKGADLSGADLPGADLPGADLPGADLSSADLSGADLSGADLSGTKAQTRSEIARLTAVLQSLQDRDQEAALTAIPIHPERDPSGYLLSSLWKWRRQRQGAIQRELRRLRKIVGEDAAAAAVSRGTASSTSSDDDAERQAALKTEL